MIRLQETGMRTGCKVLEGGVKMHLPQTIEWDQPESGQELATESKRLCDKASPN